MKSWRRDIVIIFGILLILAEGLTASEFEYSTDSPRQTKAAIITCKGDIDYGLYKSLKRRTKVAVEHGADYIIYEVGTYGGLLKSADDISKFFILDIPELYPNAHTVAYVTTEAISAGALISVSCKDIIMKEHTTIGDCAPISMTGTIEGVEREKIESPTRGFFSRAAHANNYPEALLHAMVSINIEVYRIKNLETDEYEFFKSEALPDDADKYDIDNKELVDSSDELLTLTATKAKEYGIAREVVQDVNEALVFLAERDNVSFEGQPILLETTWSEELARWLNSTAVMGILVLVALLGVYMEFHTPGLGLPGLIALICFIIIIGSKYISGLANWIEVAMFFTGVILLLIELFVIPGFGIAGFTGIALIFAGLFGMLIKNAPNEFPWPSTNVEWADFNQSIIALLLGFSSFLICAWLLSKYLTKIPFLNKLILEPNTSVSEIIMPVNMTRPKESETESLHVGDIGEVISTLRPTGKAKFSDAIVDVVAEGDFVNNGTKVEVIKIQGNRVVVKVVF